ncbi:MAG TPA: hypothetical protein VIY86_11635 [Pirellulaceae bacterium]
MAEFKRITKAAARKLFNAGKPIYLCPHKMRPGFPWNMAALIFSKGWLEKATVYEKHPDLWKGSVEETAWDLMYNNWMFYNSNYEMGYYPAYYVE